MHCTSCDPYACARPPQSLLQAHATAVLLPSTAHALAGECPARCMQGLLAAATRTLLHRPNHSVSRSSIMFWVTMEMWEKSSGPGLSIWVGL